MNLYITTIKDAYAFPATRKLVIEFLKTQPNNVIQANWQLLNKNKELIAKLTDLNTYSSRLAAHQ